MYQNQTVVNSNLKQIEDALTTEYKTSKKSDTKMYVFGNPEDILKRITGLYELASLDCGGALNFEYADLYDRENNVIGLVYHRNHHAADIALEAPEVNGPGMPGPEM